MQFEFEPKVVGSKHLCPIRLISFQAAQIVQEFLQVFEIRRITQKPLHITAGKVVTPCLRPFLLAYEMKVGRRPTKQMHVQHLVSVVT